MLGVAESSLEVRNELAKLEDVEVVVRLDDLMRLCALAKPGLLDLADTITHPVAGLFILENMAVLHRCNTAAQDRLALVRIERGIGEIDAGL